MDKSLVYENVKRIHTEWCKRCEEKHGKKDVDECFRCEFHNLFNEIYEELNNHG